MMIIIIIIVILKNPFRCTFLKGKQFNHNYISSNSVNLQLKKNWHLNVLKSTRTDGIVLTLSKRFMHLKDIRSHLAEKRY